MSAHRPGRAGGDGERVTVLIVDDHRTLAEALGLAFDQAERFTVTIGGGGGRAPARVAEDRPDVVLADLDAIGDGNLDSIRRIKDAHPGAAVLVLSAREDDLLKARAVEAGASAILSKVTPVADLPELALRAHRGEALIDREEVIRLLRVLRKRRHQEATERQRVNRLTPRQTEILQLVANGVAPAEIAQRLGMSPHTLRTHVQNVLTRLGVHTKLEAVALAIRHDKISVGG